MGKVRDKVVLPMAAVSMVALLGACPATQQVSMQTPAAGSRFLPAPSLLQPGQSGQVDQVYISPSANWRSYSKMMLDPVTIWSGPGANFDNASPKTQKALADAFYSAVYNAASQRCQMVREPGPGTMRWRVALVDASSANPFLNTLSTFEPHVKLADMLAGVVFDGGVAYWVGQATAEGYAKDATTGALLWEGQDSRAGTKAFMRDTLNSWVDVDNAFKAWADQFAQRLSDWGACSQKK